MSRCVPVMLACGVLVTASACSGDDGEPTSLEGRPQAATLRLPSGTATRRFDVTAPDPSSHTFDVRVIAPTRADVSVGLQTADGRSLNVLGSSKDSSRCEIGPTRTICLLRFPALEGQRAGRWTVLVAKRSLPAANVRVEVIFRQA